MIRSWEIDSWHIFTTSPTKCQLVYKTWDQHYIHSKPIFNNPHPNFFFNSGRLDMLLGFRFNYSMRLDEAIQFLNAILTDHAVVGYILALLYKHKHTLKHVNAAP